MGKVCFVHCIVVHIVSLCYTDISISMCLLLCLVKVWACLFKTNDVVS